MFENETFLVIFKHCESKEGFEYLFLGVSPLLLSPHEALGHKFWLKGGEREKKILGDTGSLSISFGQNITRKPWIMGNMTWKN